MRLLLLADGAVGAKISDFLTEKYADDLVLIVTTKINEIYCNAQEKKIPAAVFDQDEILSKLQSNVDLGVLAWWPKIIKSPLLELPKLGFLNTHPSLLPYNRGKHYNFWALVEQAPFGVTLHLVDSGVDTGPVVAQQTIKYDWSDTGETLYKKAQEAIYELFCNTYPMLRTGQFKAKPQELHAGSFHRAYELELASKIDLDANYRARDLLNLLRARTFSGYPGCWFEENGARYEISINIKKVEP